MEYSYDLIHVSCINKNFKIGHRLLYNAVSILNYNGVVLSHRTSEMVQKYTKHK